MRCPSCQKELEGGPSFCDSCGQALTDKPSQPSPTKQMIINPLLFRYRQAYRVTNSMINIGSFVKWGGCGLAGLMLVGGAQRSAGSEFMLIPFAIFLGVFSFVVGTLVQGMAQIQLATLDSAVYTSTFLTNEERAQILSLPINS